MEKFKGKWALIVSILLGVLAVFLVNLYLKRERAKVYEGMEMVKVVVASENIREGTTLKADMLATKEMPRKFLQGGVVYPEDVSSVLGQEIAVPLKSGDVLLWSFFKAKEVQFKTFSGLIKEGERAISIPVDDISSISNLVRPNDHVDILGTFVVPGQNRTETITILQNVTILAIGGFTAADFAKASPTQKLSYSTVTLLVSPEEAELLTFAQTKGKLTLALRNPDDFKTEAREQALKFEDLFRSDVRQDIQKKRNQRIIEIIRGGK